MIGHSAPLEARAAPHVSMAESDPPTRRFPRYSNDMAGTEKKLAGPGYGYGREEGRNPAQSFTKPALGTRRRALLAKLAIAA